MSRTTESGKTASSRKLIDVLERGVRAVLNNPDATVSEKLAAINAGAKLLAVRFRIEGSDEKGFFD